MTAKLCFGHVGKSFAVFFRFWRETANKHVVWVCNWMLLTLYHCGFFPLVFFLMGTPSTNVQKGHCVALLAEGTHFLKGI